MCEKSDVSVNVKSNKFSDKCSRNKVEYIKILEYILPRMKHVTQLYVSLKFIQCIISQIDI